MLAQPMPMPIAGTNSIASVVTCGSAIIPAPASTRQTPCSRAAPIRRASGTIAKAARQAMPLYQAAITPLVSTAEWKPLEVASAVPYTERPIA